MAVSCSNGKSKAPLYETVTLNKGSLSRTVTATGTIEPVNQIEVGTQVSGIVDKIYVDYNSVVTKGQLLAEMDRTTLLADLKSAEAMLSSAEVDFQYQTRNYERSKRLHDKGLISDTDFETAEYQYNTSKLSLNRQRSDILRTRRNLEYATITSPIDGVILSRDVEEGQTVAAGFNTPKLFGLAADLTQMRVIANVDEADIGIIAEGQRVEFSVDAFPSEVFEGSVTQVRLNPKTESKVTTYQVVVAAPNPDLKLKPGLTANIVIFAVDHHDVFIVPMKALRFTPNEEAVDNNGSQIWLLRDNKPVKVDVKVGDNDNINSVVESEILNEGDLVITTYTDKKNLAARKKAVSVNIGASDE